MGTGIDPEPQKVKRGTSFWRSFWGQFGAQILIVFFMFFERVLFGVLGLIREAMGGKVVQKGSRKVSKSDHFEARVDFRKRWFYFSQIIIFEVLEVLGDDLETISEMKAGKGALEECLRLPFCRFG